METSHHPLGTTNHGKGSITTDVHDAALAPGAD